MRRARGVTLIEMLCSVALTTIVVLGVVSGVNTLKNMQYRTDTVIRLTSASAGIMERWKSKPFNMLKPGKYDEKEANLLPNDSVVVTVEYTEYEDLKEVRVNATHQDVRHPIEYEISTLIINNRYENKK